MALNILTHRVQLYYLNTGKKIEIISLPVQIWKNRYEFGRAFVPMNDTMSTLNEGTSLELNHFNPTTRRHEMTNLSKF